MRVLVATVLTALLMMVVGCAASGGTSPGNAQKIAGEAAKQSAMTAAPPAGTAALDATTAVLFGGGQTSTITVTDQLTIRSLRAELAGAQPLSKPEAPATLFFAWFRAGDQQVAQLWMLREQANNDVLAVRFEGESDWRAVSPALNGLLKPILARVPGPKMP